MIEIYRSGMNITCGVTTLPSQGSRNIPIKIVNDDTYQDYVLQAKASYKDMQVNDVLLGVKNNEFILPQQVFAKNGYVIISLSLIKDNVEIVTNTIKLIVHAAPIGNIILPETEFWQKVVADYAHGLFDVYKVTDLEPIKQEVVNAGNQAVSNITNAKDTALSQMSAVKSQTEEIMNQTLQIKNDTQEIYNQATQVIGNIVPRVESLEQEVGNIVNLIYPIGIIVEFYNETNPNTQFPGTTWIQTGAGRVTVGKDTAQTEFNALGKTGGSKTHTLTISQMPVHTHTINSNGSHTHAFPGHVTRREASGYGINIDLGFTDRVYVDNTGGGSNGIATTNVTTAAAHTHTANNIGSGGSHNNLQPYMVVQRWRRTA